MLLVLGFAASAMAIHADIPSETQSVVAKGTTQITLGGELRFRGEYKNNMDLDDDEDTDNDAAYDGRVRLRLQADVSKNTTGVVHLESGDANNTDVYAWGGDDEGRGVYPKGNGKRGDLRILEAWIQHTGSGLLGIPAGIKVGHMPLKLGNGLFFDHSKFGDDAIVFFMDPTKELHIGLLTVKFDEGAATTVNDDANAYVALFNYTLNKDTSFSGDVTYVDDQAAGLTSAAVAVGANNTKLWNFGLRGQTNIAGFGIRADVEYQTGESEDIGGTATDIDHSGYAFLIGVDYTLAPVKLSAEFAYGSGDDDAADDDNDTFVNALSGIQKFTYVYDYRARTSMGVTNTGIANTMYAKLGASADIMKDLNALLNVYWLKAAEDNALGEDELGWEVDAKITYKIDRNLTYWVEGGYLFTGDFYDVPGTDADNAYAVRHGISLSF